MVLPLALNHLQLGKRSNAFAAVSREGFSALVEITTEAGIAEAWKKLALSPGQFIALPP